MHKPTLNRVRLTLRGLLQGIGFRPFVYQLAQEIGLTGWVQNSSQGVSIEVEGIAKDLEIFLARLRKESPPNTVIQEVESSCLNPYGYKNFQIRYSDNSGDQSTTIPPDIATCSDCLQEIFNPSGRRYLYPFTNCTHCGPRFSIMESLPYDRQNTSMKQFEMCKACQLEYLNPKDRRFHAQPNACPECGPQLEFWDTTCLSKKGKALENAVKALSEGAILAVKGLGGFHLMSNASDDQAVRRLRKRKNREEKPFALLFPNLKSVEDACELTVLEKEILLSPEAPIVLLKRKQDKNSIIQQTQISNEVAPSNPYLGVMLPSNPLHHILMDQLGFPIVATSGNISDETICAKESDALTRLRGIADFFLIHNRPIVRPIDDSIIHVVLGSGQVLRRARGLSSLPITLDEKLPSYLGIGGYLKNTVAVSKGSNIYMSQHIGDLRNSQTVSAFEETMESFAKLYGVQTCPVVYDPHPDLPTTQWAEKNKPLKIPVQHHAAHVFSGIAEHDLKGSVLGVAWDGSGYGLDGTIWGGEFFHITPESIHRVACWRPFPLPGGEAAVNQPRRSALGLLYEILGEKIFDQSQFLTTFTSEEISVLGSMLDKKVNCPMTSSCGRLFDAIASIIGIRQINSFEGQAAMELEFLTQESLTEICYSIDFIEGDLGLLNSSTNKNFDDCYDLSLKYQLNTAPLVHEILGDISEKLSLNLIATKFHNTLAESIVSLAKRNDEERVVLSGGCFQNKFLTERTVKRLREEGFQPYWHKRIPPNDGGLALGQVFAASWLQKRKGTPDVPCNPR